MIVADLLQQLRTTKGAGHEKFRYLRVSCPIAAGRTTQASEEHLDQPQQKRSSAT